MDDHQRELLSLSADVQSLRRRIAELEAAANVQQQTEAALRESEARYRALFEHSGLPIAIIDYDGIVQFVNTTSAAFFQLNPYEMVGRSLYDLLTTDAAQMCVYYARRTIETGQGQAAETWAPMPDGMRWFHNTFEPLRDASNGISAVQIVAQEITERKRAEAALRASERRYRALIEYGTNAVSLIDRYGVVLYSNPAKASILGTSVESNIGRSIFELIHPDDAPIMTNLLDALYQKPLSAIGAQLRLLHAEGSWRLVELTAKNCLDDPNVEGIVVNFQDITERQRSEQALRESEEQFRSLVRNVDFGLVLLSSESEILLSNKAALNMLGLTEEQLVGKSFFSLGWNAITEDGTLLPEDSYPAAQASTFRSERRNVVMGVQRLGEHERTWLLVSAVPLLNSDGSVRYVICSFSDITERRRAEAALRASEERYRAVSETVSDYAYGFRMEPDGTTVYEWVTDAFTRITGYEAHDLSRPDHGLGSIHPEDRDVAAIALNRMRMGESKVVEYRIIAKDGRVIWLRHFFRPVQIQGSQVIRVYGAAQDITKIKNLEHQLSQAQKMEAVGRLAGGIAHDFNNVLSIIIGNCGLLFEGLGPGHLLRYDVEQIQQAADRATNLIRQLLAFSRQQVLQPQPLSLNSVVEGLSKLLCRLIGEDIELVTHLDSNIGLVRADPGQLEQVMMNLAVNARDAMADGGQLIIETTSAYVASDGGTSSLPPGDYVVLKVSDTGCGMDESVLAQIFEPFFTTKPPGKGTGLGLATVHGIITQSGGEIRVSSTPEQGTIFQIFLPRYEEGEVKVRMPIAPAELPPGTGTVLLVEDEQRLRQLISRVLRERGYHVLEAGDGRTALTIASNGVPIDLLLTDTIMPGGLNGLQLAERLMAQRPSLRVLCMSGYADSIITSSAIEAGLAFLQKPFSTELLLQRVWEVLHGEGAEVCGGSPRLAS